MQHNTAQPRETSLAHTRYADPVPQKPSKNDGRTLHLARGSIGARSLHLFFFLNLHYGVSYITGTVVSYLP